MWCVVLQAQERPGGVSLKHDGPDRTAYTDGTASLVADRTDHKDGTVISLYLETLINSNILIHSVLDKAGSQSVFKRT